MSKPSWDIRYLEDVEKRLRALESKVEELEQASRDSGPVESKEPSPKKKR